ncbi:hypothetical protein CCICO_01380 [Corynebacterium ciconiae DSM 44920]|uniref:hypothetical protein n=1 Tax=Corynebacterium ciconiae TaxID=227319 RepID=UPI000366A0DE|nr:hypothetical protein [Corynebacterium ciconiae]WKD60330.1 hypothetical protein CCICO_01380 [Corynebacterium ciconiae DSM 44920]
MSKFELGIVIGLALAFAGILGGWGGFFLALALGALGGVLGSHFSGEIDLRRAFDSVNNRGRG